MESRSSGEFAGDYPDFHRNPYFPAPPWPSEEPIAHDSDNHRRNFSADSHHHHHHHRRQQQQQQHELHYNDFVDCADAANDFGHSPPVPGRKRPPPFSDGPGGGGFVKLYAAGVPRATPKEDIRRIFGEYGRIVEVVLLKDKMTGQKQESVFVKYRTLEDADRAIVALSDQYTFPGAEYPLQVRYAEGERERLGSFGEHLHKLFVGGMSKQTTKREIVEVFSQYGVVESIYLVRERDDIKQSRGCAFVSFSRRDMAIAAINALHGTHVMRGCDHPLIVRFAEPKKPRLGDSRAASSISEPIGRHMLPNHSYSASPRQSPRVTFSNTCPVLEQVLPSTTSSAKKSLIDTKMIDSIDCEWSEHVCPDGNLYYYNCMTCESRWEKPEEYAQYEQQIEKPEEPQNSLQMEIQTTEEEESKKFQSSTEEHDYGNIPVMPVSPTPPPACV